MPITVRYGAGDRVETRLLVDRGALDAAWYPTELWEGGVIPNDGGVPLRRRG